MMSAPTLTLMMNARGGRGRVAAAANGTQILKRTLLPCDLYTKMPGDRDVMWVEEMAAA